MGLQSCVPPVSAAAEQCGGSDPHDAAVRLGTGRQRHRDAVFPDRRRPHHRAVRAAAEVLPHQCQVRATQAPSGSWVGGGQTLKSVARETPKFRVRVGNNQIRP